MDGRPVSGSDGGATDTAGGSTRVLLFVVTFAAGFAITGIEIALGRLLAPHFGASLTIWAAIIASIIAALSIGYPIGGLLADRRPGPGLPLLSLLLGGLLGAGFGVGVPLCLQQAMAGVGLSGPAFWSRLMAVLLLFCLPCVLLAAVPPAVLRVTLRDRSTTGRDAGWLYALGSLGSVLGILLPALWWIPAYGLSRTFLLLGTVAVAPAGAGLVAGIAGKRPRRALLALPLLPALALAPERVWMPADPEAKVIYDRDSGLQRIRVTALDSAKERRRWLQLNEGWSVHSWLIEPLYATGEVWDWMALTALLPEPDDARTDVLVIGLAGGTVSNLITRLLRPLLPGLTITGVELDPEVLEVADRYLDLDRSCLETHAADGRVWLRASRRQFDLIILDAYHQPSIPAHLATVEFFGDVRAHLTPGGMAVLNAFAPAGRSRVLDGISTTWEAVFPRAQILAGPEADGFASHLLFGGPAVPLQFGRDRAGQLPEQLRAGWELLSNQVADLVPEPGVRPWTDDRAPVELLTDHAFRRLRPPNPLLTIQ